MANDGPGDWPQWRVLEFLKKKGGGQVLEKAGRRLSPCPRYSPIPGIPIPVRLYAVACQ